MVYAWMPTATPAPTQGDGHARRRSPRARGRAGGRRRWSSAPRCSAEIARLEAQGRRRRRCQARTGWPTRSSQLSTRAPGAVELHRAAGARDRGRLRALRHRSQRARRHPGGRHAGRRGAGAARDVVLIAEPPVATARTQRRRASEEGRSDADGVGRPRLRATPEPELAWRGGLGDESATAEGRRRRRRHDRAAARSAGAELRRRPRAGGSARRPRRRGRRRPDRRPRAAPAAPATVGDRGATPGAAATAPTPAPEPRASRRRRARDGGPPAYTGRHGRPSMDLITAGKRDAALDKALAWRERRRRRRAGAGRARRGARGRRRARPGRARLRLAHRSVPGPRRPAPLRRRAPRAPRRDGGAATGASTPSPRRVGQRPDHPRATACSPSRWLSARHYAEAFDAALAGRDPALSRRPLPRRRPHPRAKTSAWSRRRGSRAEPKRRAEILARDRRRRRRRRGRALAALRPQLGDRRQRRRLPHLRRQGRPRVLPAARRSDPAASSTPT